MNHARQHKEWEDWLDMSDTDFKTTPPWLPIEPPSAKLPASVTKLRAVIRDLDVENAPRYRATKTQTWCNIFVTDVIDAMGFDPGHWVAKDGTRADVGKGEELSANKLVRWFVEKGPSHGWTEADRPSAVDAAARGHLVVVGWDSLGPGSGHVAILLPEGTIAQAGRTNFVGRTIAEGFGRLPVKFFVQMRGGSHG